MQSEEEYFGDSKVIGQCSICGKEIYQSDEIYFDCNDDSCFCSTECIVKALNMKQDDDEIFEPCECNHCGEQLTDEFESVTVDGERFCDSQCAFNHCDIK